MEANSSSLPEAPDKSKFTDAEKFKDAIRAWETAYQFAYAEAFPMSGPCPPDPEPLPASPEQPIVPEQATNAKWSVSAADIHAPNVASCYVEGKATYYDPTLYEKPSGEDDSDPELGKYVEVAVSGSGRFDLTGDPKKPVTTWGVDAQEIYHRNMRRDWSEEQNVNAIWPIVQQKRQNISELTRVRAENWALDVEWRKRLGEYAQKTSAWYFDQYLPWEIKRIKHQTALNTLRDWNAQRLLDQRKRKQFIVGGVRLLVTGLLIAGLLVFGMRLVS